jgi:hypothetical protein
MGEDTGSAAGSTKVFKGSFGELDKVYVDPDQGKTEMIFRSV